MVSQTLGKHCNIVSLEILSRYWREWYESPLARNLKLRASLSWIGIAFQSRVSNFLVILRAIILRISLNVKLGIRKKFWKPARDWYSKFSRFDRRVSDLSWNQLPCTSSYHAKSPGWTQNWRWPLFTSRATFIANKISIKTAKAARTSSSSHILANNCRKNDGRKKHRRNAYFCAD